MSLEDQFSEIENNESDGDKKESIVVINRAQQDAGCVHRCLYAVNVEEQTRQTEQGRYETLCQQLPLMLRQNGLAKTVGWLEAKSQPDQEADDTEGETAELWLLVHLAWCLRSFLQAFGEEGKIFDPRSSEASWSTIKDRFTYLARNAELSDYLMLSRRALEISAWFKRYASCAWRDWP